MAFSATSTLLIGLCCLMATVQAYPLMYPGYGYYNYNPYHQYSYNNPAPGGYYYYNYGPHYPYQATANEVATGGAALKPIATTVPATAAAPPSTLPGSQIVDIQRITEFFQSLFPFLKPSNPAPATPATYMLYPPYGQSYYGQSPLMFGGSSNEPAAPGSAAASSAQMPPTVNFYSFGYPMSLNSAGSPAAAKVEPEVPVPAPSHHQPAQVQPAKTPAKV